MAKRQTGNIYKVDYFMGCSSCATEDKCVILKSLKLRCGLVGGVEMKITKCRKFEKKEVEPVEPIEYDPIANGTWEASRSMQMDSVRIGSFPIVQINPYTTITELSDSEKALPPILIQDNDKIDDTVEMESTMKRLWDRLKNVK